MGLLMTEAGCEACWWMDGVVFELAELDRAGLAGGRGMFVAFPGEGAYVGVGSGF